MSLTDQQTMIFYYYLHNLQRYTVVLLVETATNILNWAPKYGLAR